MEKDKEVEGAEGLQESKRKGRRKQASWGLEGGEEGSSEFRAQGRGVEVRGGNNMEPARLFQLIYAGSSQPRRGRSLARCCQAVDHCVFGSGLDRGWLSLRLGIAKEWLLKLFRVLLWGNAIYCAAYAQRQHIAL